MASQIAISRKGSTMRATKTLGITAATAALGGAVLAGAQIAHFGQHSSTPARVTVAATVLSVSPANDPWD
jgi:hypothetical protein